MSASFKPIMARGITVTLGLIIFSGVPFCSTGSGSRGDVPLFPLPAWRDVGLEYGDRLMLRRESQNGGSLLLKHNRRETVYKYYEKTKVLIAAGPFEWQRASSPIAECDKQSYPSQSVMRIDTQSHQLFAGNRAIAATAPTALKLGAAPSGRWVAVLSASGSADKSILPFTGGSGASGQYYHQIMSLPDAIAVGPPLRVPLRREYDSLIPCWSADEQYVVYYQVNFNYLSIVTTNLSIPTKTEKVSK